MRLDGKLVEFGKYRNQLEASKETVASLSKENSALKLDLHCQTSTHTTFSNENQRIESCLGQTGREKEMLKRRVTELDTSVLSIQDTYNELFCLKEKLILDNDTMDKELQELRSYKSLLQEREARASKELNSIISQRIDEVIQLSSKMSELPTAVSERSTKEETIATLSEVSKERVCEPKAELETATKSNSEFQKELHHVICELDLLQGQLEISKKRFETKAEQLEQKTSGFTEYNRVLETNLEQVEKQLSSRETVLQNTINGLRADILGLAHRNQTLQQEKQKLALMVKEHELMQEDNTTSVLEELEESKNRTKALEEILDDVECERNTLHSQIRSLNVQLQFAENKLKIKQKKSKIELNRDARGRYCPERKALAFEIDLGSSSDANKETRTNPKSLVSPRVLRSNKHKLSHSVSQSNSSTIKNRKT